MGIKSSESYLGQRKKEKREFYKRFRLRAVEDLFKTKFFALFGSRCFKCGALERSAQQMGMPPVLCIDHHMPLALGGHLEAGNLVALCRRCNEAKSDLHPDKFYSRDELMKLAPMLAQQEKLFEFKFDWNAWNDDRGAYLIGLGIDLSLIDEMLNNSRHRDYVGKTAAIIGIAISVDLSVLN